MLLDEWPLSYVRVKCTKCDREGKLNTDRLVEKLGNIDMFTARDKISQPGCQRTDKAAPCMSILPDAMLVQAIIEEDESKVLKPELLAEARDWRQKLGMGER
jgi:hypothetical protein